MNADKAMLLPALFAVALSCFALPADAQRRQRPTEEELRKQEQQILEELKQADEKFQKEQQEMRAGRGKKHPNLPPQDPCKLLTTAEVVAAISNAQPGKRDHFNDEDGISRCVWSSANGAPLLKLELVAVRGDKRDDFRQAPPAYRKVGAVGDEAAVWVVPRTPPALHYDMVVGTARSGKVGVQVQWIELARLGHEPGTRTLEKLMRAAVGRL